VASFAAVRRPVDGCRGDAILDGAHGLSRVDAAGFVRAVPKLGGFARVSQTCWVGLLAA